MDEQLADALKYLRLQGLLAHWDEYVRLAQKERYSLPRLLQHIIQEEYKLKQENARRLRIARAKLPEHWLFETFPFDKQPKLNRQRLVSLYDSFDYMTKHQNIIWIGPTGVGKTGLATGFLLQAIDRGYKARYITCNDLIEKLFNAAADHSQERVFKRFLSYDCLLIDELGYGSPEPLQAALFLSLIQKRHKKTTNLIISNLGFSEWQTYFKNQHLTAAVIDRLTENSHVINMKECRSIRPKKKQDQ